MTELRTQLASAVISFHTCYDTRLKIWTTDESKRISDPQLEKLKRRTKKRQQRERSAFQAKCTLTLMSAVLLVAANTLATQTMAQAGQSRRRGGKPVHSIRGTEHISHNRAAKFRHKLHPTDKTILNFHQTWFS
jgi:hypothetical protein